MYNKRVINNKLRKHIYIYKTNNKLYLKKFAILNDI